MFWRTLVRPPCFCCYVCIAREIQPRQGARVYVRGGGGVASLCCEPTRRADRCWEWRRGGRRCGEQRGPQMLQCFVPHLERRNTGRTNHPLDGLGLRAALRHVSVRVACGRRWRRSLMVRVSPSLRPSGALLRARGPIYPARLALAQGLRLSVRPLFRLQPARSQRAIKLARWPPKFSRSSPARPPARGRAAAAELGTCDDGGGNSSVARGRAPPTDAEGRTDGGSRRGGA